MRISQRTKINNYGRALIHTGSKEETIRIRNSTIRDKAKNKVFMNKGGK